MTTEADEGWSGLSDPADPNLPTSDDAGMDDPAVPIGVDLVGRKIGHYSVKSVIASGGMGTVYLALQEEPHRQVALKVMREGISSRSALRRFQFESQILARLRHPGICQIFEAGTHFHTSVREGGEGVPYFAMEYISDAKTLTEYAEVNKLSTGERLVMFRQVCDAVAHGHQRGVIHRDLKPSNILIDPTSGQPKIIDFGVARATDSDLAVTTMQTDVGQLVGTLQYMSPEQCEANPDDLDIRSDVYSLGVVLYELLCNRLPYNVGRTAVFEAARLIREESPKRLSHINRTLRGDIETIVLKALEKDRERRYQSAAELGQDIERYLNHEPIIARPPSTMYQLQRFAQRNRPAVVALALVMVILTAATIVSVIFGLREASQRAAADSARDDLQLVVRFQSSMFSELDAEMFGISIARKLRDKVEQRLLARGLSDEDVKRELDTFEVDLAMVNATDLAGDVIAANVLEPAEQKIESEFAERPGIRGTLMATVADIYDNIGRYAPAVECAAEAIAAFELESGLDHPDLLTALNNYGYFLKMKGDYEEAERVYSHVLDKRQNVYGEDHPETLLTLDNLGSLYATIGEFGKAEAAYQKVLAGLTESLGADHDDTLRALTNMASLQLKIDRADEAEANYRKVYETYRNRLGEAAIETLSAMGNLGTVLQSMGRFEEAEGFLAKALEGSRRSLGAEHPDTLLALLNYGVLLQSLGRREEAMAYYRDALEGFRHTLGPAHEYTMTAMNNMGYLCDVLGMKTEAEQYYREGLEWRRSVLGDDHQDTVITAHNFATFLRENDRLEESASLYREFVPLARQTLPESHWVLGFIFSSYGRTLFEVREFEEAEAVLLEAHEILVSELPGTHERILTNAEAIRVLYESMADEYDDSAYRRKAAEWRAFSDKRSVDESDGDDH